MTDQTDNTQLDLIPELVGPRLRFEREKQGLSVADIAGKTRISQHQIRNIEAGDFGKLPGRTYIIGFARNIAKALGLDQEEIVAMVRAELNSFVPDRPDRADQYEPGDPSRAPSGRLVWFSVIAAAILIAGLFFAVRILFSPAVQLPALVDEAQQSAAQTQPPETPPAIGEQADPTGEVVFTALGPVWVRFYDDDRSLLMEAEMAEGERYLVPADANGARIITARPDLLTITIGGQGVPKLSEDSETLQNVRVDAASLLAREDISAVADD